MLRPLLEIVRLGMIVLKKSFLTSSGRNFAAMRNPSPGAPMASYARGAPPSPTRGEGICSLTSATLVLAVLAFSLPALAQLPADYYVDKELRFAAQFARAPTVEHTTYTNRSGDTLPARRFWIADATNLQSVTVAEASKAFPIDLNLLEHAADELRQRGEIKFQADDNYDPGVPGRQFDILQPDGRQLRAFAYMQDYKLYIVESSGEPGSVPAFLFAESFTLLDEKGEPINLSP